MTFGEKVSQLRKQLKWSQDDLAKKIGTSAPIVGRYERNEIKPSIEVAVKIAEALEVTLDYLVADGALKNLNKKTLQRLEDIEKLSDDDKQHIFYALDNLIKAAKLKAL